MNRIQRLVGAQKRHTNHFTGLFAGIIALSTVVSGVAGAQILLKDSDQQVVDVCVIVLSNNYSGAASFMITDLAAMVFGEPFETSSINPGLKIDPKVIDGYLGRYEGGADFFIPRASITVEKRDGNLALRWSTGAVGWPAPMTESKFYERIFGASVTFVKDDKGKVSHLIFSISGSDYRANKAQTE